MVHHYCLGLLFSVLEGFLGKVVDHDSVTYCSNIVYATNLAALRWTASTWTHIMQLTSTIGLDKILERKIDYVFLPISLNIYFRE